MLNMIDQTKKSDSEEVFYDGFVYIISRVGEPFDEYHDAEFSIEVKCLTQEYDDPISLADIAKEYPNVCKVIYEDMLKGRIYDYGNHCLQDDAEMWELVGTTVGYA